METAHRKHPNYVLIWGYFAIFTAIEIGVAFMSHLPKQIIIPALVFFAVWKALLVALYLDRKSTRLNSSHGYISYAVFCLKKKKYVIMRMRIISNIESSSHGARCSTWF